MWCKRREWLACYKHSRLVGHGPGGSQATLTQRIFLTLEIASASMLSHAVLGCADLDYGFQIELAEGPLEAGLALSDVAGDVVPVQPHVTPHVRQVQDLLQAGSRFWLLFYQRLHQLFQIVAVVSRNRRELATAGRDDQPSSVF